jgi:hypothetical protein
LLARDRRIFSRLPPGWLFVSKPAPRFRGQDPSVGANLFGTGTLRIGASLRMTFRLIGSSNTLR